MSNRPERSSIKSTKWDVFVSHNRRDKPWVRGMVSQLRALGQQVFFDEDDIPPGSVIETAIGQGIEQSRYLLFVITPNSVASEWVALECGIVVYEDPNATHNRLIPILLEKTPKKDIRQAVRRLNMIDLTEPTKLTREYHRLLRHLGISGSLPDPPSPKVRKTRKKHLSRKQPNQAMLARMNLRIPLTYLACEYYREKYSNSQFLTSPNKMPILTRREFLPPKPLTLANIDGALLWDSEYEHEEDEWSEMKMVDALREQSPSHIYDGIVYRFLGFEPKGRFRFGRGSYFAFLNSCECLSLELAKAVSENQFAHEIVRENKTKKFHEVVKLLCDNPDIIPLRHRAKPFDFSSRCSGFGTCALVIVKRTNRPARMILNLRSKELTETPGLLHVIPAGTFQPNMTDDRFHESEFSFTENIVREFAEELLDAEDLRRPKIEHLDPLDMYSKRGKNFRQYVINNENYSAYYLGTVVDPVNLKPEILVVFMVHDGYLFNAGKHQLMKSWESGRLSFHDFTTKELDYLIGKTNIVPTGQAHFMLLRKHYEFFADALSRI